MYLFGIYQGAVQRVRIKNVVFAIDSIKLNIQKPGNEICQSVFYNGWTHGHYTSNVFIFAPNGQIVAMVVNAPG